MLILKTFETFYPTPAENLLAKLPKAPNRYTNNFVSDYYKELSLSENFILDSTTQGFLFKLL